MSAAAVIFSMPAPSVPEVVRPHPVPRGARRDDVRLLLRRAAALSIALHLSLVAIAVVIGYWPRSGVVGTPQEHILDVSIIPLSALDTVLPKGAPAPPEPAPAVMPVQQPTKEDPSQPNRDDSQPKRIVERKSPRKNISTVQSADRAPASPSSTSGVSSQSQSQFGVPNGDEISIERARISYQDMVATLLARAKRYPERALKRGVTGEGSIRLEISSDGSLANFQIVRSTDTPILDEELRAMVNRAAPFPAFPSDLRKRTLALIVPIAFRLQG